MPKALATRPRAVSSEAKGLVVRRHGATGRSYTYNGKKFLSVSNVKDTFPKHLADWGARVERAHVLDALEAVIADGNLWQRDVSPSGLRAQVLEACGEKHAWTAKLSEAGSIGHQTHAAIERWLARRVFEAGDGPDPGPLLELEHAAAIRSFARFVEWAKDVDMMPIAAELSVCSPTYEFGGTLDDLALIEGRPAVLDWKTGGSLYLEDHCQVAAYVHGYNEFEPAQVRGIRRVEDGYLVHLPKTDDDAETTVKRMPWEELEHHYGTFRLAIPLAYRIKEWKAQRDFEKARAAS